MNVQVATAIPNFIEKIQEIDDQYQQATYPGIAKYTRNVYGKSKGGKRFTRITVITNGDEMSLRVFCFIDNETGDVLKSEGWKRPAPHPRGNLLADDLGISALNPNSKSLPSIRYL